MPFSHQLLLYLILFISILTSSISVQNFHAFGETVDPKNGLQIGFDAKILENAIVNRRQQIELFKVIQNHAKKYELRVWIIGGAAASYAQFVKWNLAKEAGDSRFIKDDLYYNSSHIFRSTQDIDLVVDGSKEGIKSLQQFLESSYPQMKFEIRKKIGEWNNKFGIEDSDFQEQNTDSFSQGLIEITNPPEGKPIISDSLHFIGRSPSLFLRDISKDRITFLNRPNHHATSRAKDGLNPEIIGAIRFLIKALQFGLSISDYDYKKIIKIVSDFEPDDIKPGYLTNWMNYNAKKLVTHSLDVERSFALLREVRLLDKLKKIGSTKSETDLAFWMNKEPLPSLGLSSDSQSVTAKTRGLSIVNHETSNYSVYESLSAHPFGKANALISRPDTPGEFAQLGNGFYITGDRGALYNTTGLIIRYEMDPRAQEGTDYILDPEAKENPLRGRIRILNSSILRRIPELKIKDIWSLFQKVARGWIPSDEEFGILFQWKKYLSNLSHAKLRHYLFNPHFHLSLDRLPKLLQAKICLLMMNLADDRKLWNDFFSVRLKSFGRLIKKEKYREDLLLTIKDYIRRGGLSWMGFLTHLDLSLKEYRFINSLEKDEHRHSRANIIRFELQSLPWFMKQIQDEIDLSIIDILEDDNLEKLMDMLSDTDSIRNLKLVLMKSKVYDSSRKAVKKLDQKLGRFHFFEWTSSNNLSQSARDQVVSIFFENALNRSSSISEFTNEFIKKYIQSFKWVTTWIIAHRLMLRNLSSSESFLEFAKPLTSNANIHYFNALLALLIETESKWLPIIHYQFGSIEFLAQFKNMPRLYEYFLGHSLPHSAIPENFLQMIDLHKQERDEEDQRTFSQTLLKNLPLFQKMNPTWKQWAQLKEFAPDTKGSMAIQKLMLKNAESITEVLSALKPTGELTPEYRSEMNELLTKQVNKIIHHIENIRDAIKVIKASHDFAYVSGLIHLRKAILEKGMVKSFSDFVELASTNIKSPSEDYSGELSSFISDSLPRLIPFNPSSEEWLKLSALATSIKLSDIIQRKAAESATTSSDLKKSFKPTVANPSDKYLKALAKIEADFSDKLKSLLQAEQEEEAKKIAIESSRAKNIEIQKTQSPTEEAPKAPPPKKSFLKACIFVLKEIVGL